VSALFEPPPSDRELSEQLVRLAMQSQFGHMDVGRVERLASGWEYDVYLVDDHLVVRFPRYAEVAEHLSRAEALLGFVGAELGSEVTVPRITLRGEPGPHFPHRFFGHELIPGVPAADAAEAPVAALASDLGRALTLIHGISAARASRLGVGPQKWFCHSSFDGLVDALQAVPEVGRLVPEAAPWVHGSATVPPEYSGPPRFIHDDLQPEHIIVHPDSGRLSGIIDWGAALGDPAQDFSFIAAWAGWRFTMSVLDHYHGPADVDFEDRLLFLGRVRALGWLAYEVQMDLDTHRTQRVARDLLCRS
jgi:aminoglycoside phosphotransferase (APT) family kinase protein